MKKFMSVRFITSFLILSLFFLGCSAFDTARDEWEDRTIALDVTNYHWSEAVIYVYHGGSGVTRQRLGEVPSMATRNFTLPLEFSTDPLGFTIFAYLIGTGSKSYSTGLISAHRVQVVEVTIQENLRYSTYVVR